MEPSLEKRAKYLGFIDAYTDLDESETEAYRQSRAEEVSKMGGLSHLWKEEGRKEGRQEGVRTGGSRLLLHQMTLKFGKLSYEVRQKI